MKDKKEEKVVQTEDVREFAEMLNDLSSDEKAQVKGIVIGLMMAKESRVMLSSGANQVMQPA